MSRLFLATDKALGRRVVIKALPPELGSDVSIARFRREIQLAARLQHPNILGVLSAGGDADLVWYAMPFVEGESLRQRMDREGPLSVELSVRWLREVADALDYAHRRGVVHRDVKPENILLAAEHALLADFGIAHALAASRGDERLTVSGMSLGTPGYMAPEQAAGAATDGRSDIYALGLVGWEMLAGHPPFSGRDERALLAAHLSAPAPPLQTARGDVPHAMASAMARALEKDPLDRFQTAAEFREALAPTTAASRSGRPVARLVAAFSALVAVAAIAVWSLTKTSDAPLLDRNVIAVAPFDVHEAELALWREGLADILSRNLDGAGPLRSVPPTIVVRRWRGRADSASARALAQSTGAGMALFGALTRSGKDSVRLRAALLDVTQGRTLREVDLRDGTEHVDRLADSAAVTLLRELGGAGMVGAVRLTSLGSRSMLALKTFLRGEQFYRSGFMDSARAEYERAVAIDTTFGLAFNRLAKTIGWTGSDTDPRSLALRLRAAALTQGLSRRDSLLLLADSNHAAGLLAATDTGTWRHARRAIALLNSAARDYPLDPQIWHELGEESIHQVHFAPAPIEVILARFERAIEIDSQFSPAYPHAIELAAAVHDTAKVLRLIASHRRWARTPGERPGYVEALEAVLTQGLHVLDSVTPTARLAHGLTQSLGYMLDASEPGVLVARRYVNLAQREGVRLEHAKEHLASALAFHGHVREARAVGSEVPRFVAELTLLGGDTSDTVRARFDSWRRESNPSARLALAYWAMRGDTVSTRDVATRADERLRRAAAGLPRAIAQNEATEARFFHALARHDTVAAVRLVPHIIDSLCLDGCDLVRFAKGRVLASQGRYEEAKQVFTPRYRTVVAPLTPLFLLERARVSERLGDDERALRDFQFVARAWRAADPALRQYAEEATASIERLGTPRDAMRPRPVPRRP